MNKKGFGYIPVIVIVAILVVGVSVWYHSAHRSSASPSGAVANNTGRDLTVQDLVAYFNNKLSCDGGKVQPGPQPCFDSNFHAVDPAGGIYDNPIYQLVDFTGDGKLDALVTIYYSGSGSQRDFYALAVDPALTGDSKMNLVTYIQGAGVSRSAAPPYFVNGAITLNSGSASAFTLVWDKLSHNFVNSQGKPKELLQQ